MKSYILEEILWCAKAPVVWPRPRPSPVHDSLALPDRHWWEPAKELYQFDGQFVPSVSTLGVGRWNSHVIHQLDGVVS